MKLKLLSFEFLGKTYTINNEFNIKISSIGTMGNLKKL